MAHVLTRSLITLSLACAVAACGKSEPAPAGVASTPPAAAAEAAAPPVFSEYTAADATGGGNCSLDAINGGAVQAVSLATGAAVMFGGWVTNGQGNVPGEAQLVLRGPRAYSIPLVAGGERPDVAQALNNEAARMSGFNVATTLAGVEPGEYVLSIALGDAEPASCALNTTLVVTGG